MFFKPFLPPLLAAILVSQTSAAIIGTNIPSSPLTAARIAALPAAEQPAWKNYLENSARQMLADQDFLRAELKMRMLKTTAQPAGANSTKGISLDAPADWYGQAEARHIAEVIVSFQTPAGGWSKNLDMTRAARRPGESFAAEDAPKNQPAADNDAPLDRNWNYIGTFDNDATVTQLRFLAKVVATGGTNGTAFRESFLRGLGYIFAAQFPNGGWPQVWPLQGGYHDAVTFNDDAMLNVLALLRDVAGGENEFAFVPAQIRAKAAANFKRGLDCLLAAQIVVNGRRTVWCQQHDALTLQPASARNYEMPAQTSSESAAIILFLMQLPEPDSNVVSAVHAACAWFEKTKIADKAFKLVAGRGRELVDAPGSTVWARYYEIVTDRPIFGDRDKSIHDDVSEISLERRNGYGWFRDTPKRVLEHYARWSKLHPQP